MPALTNAYANAPFAYHGGKRRMADMVWDAFGKVDCYSEPFFGGGAILLRNPNPAFREVVGDINPYLSNFWRSLQTEPLAVARWADFPPSHVDLYARHVWLLDWGRANADKLWQDPNWFDPKAAGWWAWGMSNWIGAGWCLDEKAHDKIPQVTSFMGVSAVRLADGQKEDTPFDGTRLQPWLLWLHNRLRRVIVLHRPWRSCVTDSLLHKHRRPDYVTAVFLDPPYRTDEGNRTDTLYVSDLPRQSTDCAKASYAWALEHGENPKLRIAYCCRQGDFAVPAGWSCFSDVFLGVRRKERRVEHRDLVMFSPHCQPASNRQMRLI